MSSILVTGGTGSLGRVVVDLLVGGGHDVRVASRRPQPPNGERPYTWVTVDYRSGDGLEAAVNGVDTIIHCAGSLRVAVDQELIAAARQAGAPHLVYISIVGVDRVPFGYYRTKHAAEKLIENSGLPWTILRATQFHDLIRLLLAITARSPIMLVPDIRFQPVDVREVAARLAELATAAPAGRVADMGGPKVHDIRELAAIYLRATGRRRLVLPIRLPGKAFLGYRQGGHLTPDHAVGTITFDDYLAQHSARTSLSYRGQRR